MRSSVRQARALWVAMHGAWLGGERSLVEGELQTLIAREAAEQKEEAAGA